MQPMRIFSIIVLAVSMLPSMAQSASTTVELSQEEAMFVRSILLRDELLRELPKAQKSLSALNTLLKAAPTGPVKIALAWNQAAIKTWRLANKKLDEIGKATICDELQMRTEAGTTNIPFFEQLFESRGCSKR
jgi:hypothetical protein